MPPSRGSSRPLRRTLLVPSLLALITTTVAGVAVWAAEPTAAPPAVKSGPPAKPAAPLPPARPVDDIIRDVVAALGGAPAIMKHHSEHTKMTIAFQGLGITGTAEHWAAPGDKALTTTEIPNVASTREGSDGTRSWSQDPINGLRVLSGAEAEQAHLEAAWAQELRFKELFPKIEAKNDVADDGTRLECLILTPRLSPPMTDCFDARTHLLVSQRGVRSGPQGETPFVARMKDWRPVAGIQVPFATEMQVGPLSFVGTVTLAEFDVPVAATLFAVPDVAPKGEDKGEDKGAGKGKTKPARPAKRTKERPADAPAQ